MYISKYLKIDDNSMIKFDDNLLNFFSILYIEKIVFI